MRAYVEDLETGNVKHADEVGARNFLRVECLVAHAHDPVEHAVEDALRHRTLRPVDLRVSFKVRIETPTLAFSFESTHLIA